MLDSMCVVETLFHHSLLSQLIRPSWSKVCSCTAIDEYLIIIIHTLARNECLPISPCVNGYCQDGINQYFCICYEGFIGDRCDQPGMLLSCGLLTVFISLGLQLLHNQENLLLHNHQQTPERNWEESPI